MIRYSVFALINLRSHSSKGTVTPYEASFIYISNLSMRLSIKAGNAVLKFSLVNSAAFLAIYIILLSEKKVIA